MRREDLDRLAFRRSVRLQYEALYTYACTLRASKSRFVLKAYAFGLTSREILRRYDVCNGTLYYARKKAKHLQVTFKY